MLFTKLFALIAFVALAFILLDTAVFAQVTMADSLEWMTVDSSLIVKGKVIKSDHTDDPRQNPTDPHECCGYTDVTVQVSQTLKGLAQGQTVKFRMYAHRFLKNASGECVFFLKQGENRDGHDRFVGWWVPRSPKQFLINIEAPYPVYRANVMATRNVQNIMATIEKYASRTMTCLKTADAEANPYVIPPQQGFLALEVKGPIEEGPPPWRNGPFYLNVPAEGKYRKSAMSLATSKDFFDRINGVDMLRNYPGADTVKLLRSLLADHVVVRAGKIDKEGDKKDKEAVDFDYPVRIAAYNSLIALGEKVQKPCLRYQRKIDKLREDTSLHSIGLIESLEWMTVDSDLIARCKVLEQHFINDPREDPDHPFHRSGYTEFKVPIEETLKGAPAHGFIKVRTDEYVYPDKGEYIFFLKRGTVESNGSYQPAWVSRFDKQFTTKCNVQQSLFDPAVHSAPQHRGFMIKCNMQRVYKADGSSTRDLQDILNTIRRCSNKKTNKRQGMDPEQTNPFFLLPQQGFIFTKMRTAGYGDCSLVVPAEEQYRKIAIAMARSQDCYKRANGANMLRNYPGEETIKILKSLLDDSIHFPWRVCEQGKAVVNIVYPVRIAAYNSLFALGQGIKKPILKFTKPETVNCSDKP